MPNRVEVTLKDTGVKKFRRVDQVSAASNVLVIEWFHDHHPKGQTKEIYPWSRIENVRVYEEDESDDQEEGEQVPVD